MASYLKWYNSPEWNKRIEAFSRRLESCDLCPHKCGVNRLEEEKGFCRAGLRPRVASWNPHRGEEPPVSGVRGSGTIFLSHCTLRCVYCQNYSLSQLGEGKEVPPSTLADYYLQLQQIGCHNLNLVTPTHYLPQLLKALDLAIEKGFSLPIVYNTSGYERKEIISELEGIVDIYMPDLRYCSNQCASQFSEGEGYVENSQAALKEMYRQVGGLQCDASGIAYRGLLIRHLVLPGHISESKKAMAFISDELGSDVYISLMKQYFPAYKAAEYSPLNRMITSQEFEEARQWMEKYNLSSGWVQ